MVLWQFSFSCFQTLAVFLRLLTCQAVGGARYNFWSNIGSLTLLFDAELQNLKMSYSNEVSLGKRYHQLSPAKPLLPDWNRQLHLSFHPEKRKELLIALISIMPLTYGTRATTKLSQKNGTHRSSSALPTSPYGDLSSVSCTANSQTQVTDRIDPQIIAKSDRRRTNLGTCYLQCLQRRGRRKR